MTPCARAATLVALGLVARAVAPPAATPTPEGRELSDSPLFESTRVAHQADAVPWDAIARELNAELAVGSRQNQHRSLRTDADALDWSAVAASINDENGLAPGASRPIGRGEADPDWGALMVEAAEGRSTPTP